MDVSSAANKAQQLERLRQQRAGTRPVHNGQSTAGHGYLPGYTPPPQSRDGSTSRFFPQGQPTHGGNVLAPNSSPLRGQQSPYRPHPYPANPYQHVAPIQTQPVHLNAWSNKPKPYQLDPLSAPTGFHNPSANSHASNRRPREDDHPYGQHGARIEEGPPRKRINLGQPDEEEHSFDGGSPGVVRPGQRRAPASDVQPQPSDESIMLDGSPAGPSRIIRGQRPLQPAPPPIAQTDEVRFNRFKITMPQHSADRAHAAWEDAKGDAKRASILLESPGWSPRPRHAAPAPAEVTGRVKELEEANRSRREAQKEKAKKSAIYAGRQSTYVSGVPQPAVPVLAPHSSSSRAAPVLNVVRDSPPRSPIMGGGRRAPRRGKKMIVNSESEFSGDSDDEDNDKSRAAQERADERRALDYFNMSAADAIQELTGCSPAQADTIISMRPFDTVEDLNTKLGQGRKKMGPSGISPRMFEDCTAIFEGYGAVDTILQDCETIGATLRAAIASWSAPANAKEKETDTSADFDAEDGALNLHSLVPAKDVKSQDFLTSQPSLLPEGVNLKDYQLLGVNWLNLLYRRRLSCILADEMGLGKTIQVISFLALLKEKRNKGPHLVVVPSSTLENWCREFAKFAPSISVQTYYAGKEERPELRQMLLETQRSTSESGEGWEVLITTYNLAQGDDRDRKFFRRVEWECCVFDEGHVLKNFQSQRYQALLKYESKWRLLLTGTPLQNNLQELVSLMNFILPHRFADAMDSLRAIFKTKGDNKASMLSQERVSRAKKMMTPFVLRRRKDQVLKDLPNKTERIHWCEMTDLQRGIYRDALQRSRKTVLEPDAPPIHAEPATNGNSKAKIPKKKPAKPKPRAKDKMYLENSSNVLMDLRKAASHPMLFRTRFDDETLNGVTKQLLKEPDFKKRGATAQFVKEDMEVMTDAELQLFCGTYKSTRKYLQDETCYLEAGKVTALLGLLEDYSTQGRKVLIFSQFTQILDILQAILKQKDIKYLLLTGSTPVDVRQSLVDEFTEDPELSVFLLSTKAGGMGINLVAASVVIMFDQDFNPHNDKQAQDRAYRIGQKRDVEVIKLITRGTIEEDMLKLGQTKLALDEAVAGDTEENDSKGESAPEREMKSSLMSALRQQFEQDANGTGAGGTGTPATTDAKLEKAVDLEAELLDHVKLGPDQVKREGNGVRTEAATDVRMVVTVKAGGFGKEKDTAIQR